MSGKENNGTDKITLALAGLVLMLIADIVADLSMFIGDYSIIYWAEVVVTALAWIMIIIGFLALKNIRKEFARGLIVSVIGFLSILGEAFFVYSNIHAGISDNGFIAMKPMFCEYFSDLMMLLVLYLLVRGCGQLVAKGGDMNLAHLSIRKSNLEPIIALIAMVLVHFGTIFTMPISIIIGAVGIILNAAVRLDMINYAKAAIKQEI